MKTRTLLLCAIAFVATGCAQMMKTYDPSNQGQVMGKVTKKYDEFKRTTQYTGPSLAEGTLDYVSLRAFAFENPPNTIYQIYVSDYYNGNWKFYDYAYDSDGNKLDFVRIDRRVSGCSSYGCSHTEDFALNVSRKYLQDRASTGIRFKVSGKGGEEIFFIPASYINGFLQVVPDTSSQEKPVTEKKAKKQKAS